MADQPPYTAALHDSSAGRPQQGVDQSGTGFGFVHRERCTPVTPASCSQSCEAPVAHTDLSASKVLRSPSKVLPPISNALRSPSPIALPMPRTARVHMPDRPPHPRAAREAFRVWAGLSAGRGRAVPSVLARHPRTGPATGRGTQADGLAGARGLRERRVCMASLRVSRAVPLPPTLARA